LLQENAYTNGINAVVYTWLHYKQDTSSSMKIWIDADACPNVIKDILFRAAERAQIETILVANQAMRLPPSRFIRFVQVAAGADVADKHIVDLMQAGDLVITADIPLAAAVIEKNGIALNPRGELYTKENIRERLSMRNFMEELRNGGVMTGGPPILSAKDRQLFANKLDAWIAKRK
jgi:uncharacterized protein YaiI (UPF0178 family)